MGELDADDVENIKVWAGWVRLTRPF